VAQATPITAPARRPSRRQDLEQAAAVLEQRAKAERDAGRRSEFMRQAGVIRARLAQGDFLPGHRILLFVGGDSALVDTFTVRADQKLQLPDLPDITLAGVLDSELQGYLKTQLAQYIRNPDVRAQALLRVSVSGDVGSPGFYSIRTDTPVSDVIMTAGGPSPSADMSKVVLRRGSEVVIPRQGIQEAIRSERTMTEIGVRPGDELYVPTKPPGSNWQKIAAVAATVTGIVWTLVYIADR
jgi:protein involved in polysaccharide export with SLBB domain